MNKIVMFVFTTIELVLLKKIGTLGSGKVPNSAVKVAAWAKRVRQFIHQRFTFIILAKIV